MRLLVIGHSHIKALMSAAESGGLAADLSFVFLQDKRFRPAIQKGDLGEALRSTIVESEAELIVSCIGGNVHNVLGLVEHPRPFDFILPQAANLPIDEKAELIPSEIVVNWLKTHMKPHMAVMLALRRFVEIPIAHLESPPPVPSEHARRFPRLFAEKLKLGDVAPELLRFKLWSLHSHILMEFCRENGIEFIAAPDDIRDDSGMLVEQARGEDPTHGNGWFGSRMIETTLAHYNRLANQAG